MSGVLLILSIVLGVCKSSLYNRYAKTEKPGLFGICLFNGVAYGIAAVEVLLLGVSGSMSPFTFVTAFGYALIVCSFQGLSILTMREGPMALTSVIILYSMIIPSLAGPLFWHEPFGILQGVGVALMLASLWLLREKDTAATEKSGRWTVLVILCFLLSGGAGVMEKIHQSSTYKAELPAFLLTAFSLMFVFSLTGTLVCGIRQKSKSVSRTTLGRALLYGGGAGVIVGIYNRVNLTLAGLLDSLVYYPIANGGALLLTVLVATVLFREKLTGRRLAGFLVGLGAIVCLSIPV